MRSRRPAPDAVRMRSRSQTKAVSAKLLLSASTYWVVTPLSSPTGEYFLKMTSPSPVVKISSGSPRRMRWVRRISFGMTTRPSSSMRRTMPVAFIAHSPFLCSAFPLFPDFVFCGYFVVRERELFNLRFSAPRFARSTSSARLQVFRSRPLPPAASVHFLPTTHRPSDRPSAPPVL